jgi:hypothetical protein
MPEQSKGQAGMGGRGKNQAKTRQDKATRRTVRTQGLVKAHIPGSPSGKNPRRRNQKRNQRTWHEERRFAVKKANRAQVGT